MKEQKSFQHAAGCLYLVPTPIGNLEDMTFRGIRILKEADLIAAEDTRQTRKLTAHFDIHTPLVSYHEHNQKQAGADLLAEMEKGKTIALVSDAGMPGISDPGEALAKLCIDAGIPVVALPGANAALTALVASGLPAKQFAFHGFLPRGKKDRKEALARLATAHETMLFYEAPHRLSQTLAAMYEAFGDREIAIGRELTKKFEEYQRGLLSEAVAWTETGTIKGEFCLVVEGASQQANEEQEQWWASLSETAHVDHYIAIGLSQKDAIKQVAVDRGVPKRQIYQMYHQH
ncbi:16S rRNA (cytidine(1402)-2'-O)-methyltransferase [Shouchella clausii]|uniref:16S rRNA (cytidine(1402)-2'-O)-methyltransferase n=1 Tax=Shouchella clausii TaxID=79880 RepID=UPI000BA59616|nr:16S rRNA (cytidine(1402)-2'-O)-methyltransferase [Shouchella clausii]SPU18484.1 corrin/porphyrin methyltransferase [Niallia circulans]MBU8598244.1 16S rRNA (cytidine(1402)-2'-O)-methyltransferase [Shouchella clausii]MCM3550250.1 16S rRNA (cytidine(1402)-2'-O)-methyltransferase [Shouchella clausii]MCY1106928.1 16S rRNA (cytidine(1402)-2'-O)-methyltransferase [Shouchella clausii]MED4160315.1 16S rRNA (cytidine(1402)-2'-O)-methyltransferase [Shouchella clausii]